MQVSLYEAKVTGNEKKIVLITDKQPSSNPRLVKEAVALYGAGYSVTVIYNFWSVWAEEADKNIFSKFPGINWKRVGGHPVHSKINYWATRLLHKLYKVLADKFPGNLLLQVKASSLFYPALQSAASNIKADLYIAHNLSALPAAACAAKKNASSYAFDAEDFHRSQEAVSAKQAASVKIIEDHYFDGAKYITAASPLISTTYKKLYPQKEFETVNNVFSKTQQPVFTTIPGLPLKLFWFSQTVGLRRGLQDAVSAMNMVTAFPIELNILGDAGEETKNELLSLLTSSLHKVNFIAPCNEDELIKISSIHHIGLALEPGYSLNYQIALTNKVFTYILAGNALLLSATQAQEIFFKENPSIGWCYPPGDIAAFADILNKAGSNIQLLSEKRSASWTLGNAMFNWEVEQERFLKKVKEAV
jgi:glycosyltransferase involved in cell wall biosynthesis